jgi:hypothetical protein
MFSLTLALAVHSVVVIMHGVRFVARFLFLIHFVHFLGSRLASHCTALV